MELKAGESEGDEIHHPISTPLSSDDVLSDSHQIIQPLIYGDAGEPFFDFLRVEYD